MPSHALLKSPVRSPPARVAWIETYTAQFLCFALTVATREGGVDRNKQGVLRALKDGVATREGGVDRNVDVGLFLLFQVGSPPARVAWIETPFCLNSPGPAAASPPARVAWIETFEKLFPDTPAGVATREGGVDRNFRGFVGKRDTVPSPPARVAWIETGGAPTGFFLDAVATREGGVDRNDDSLALGAGRKAVATREGGVDRNMSLLSVLSLVSWSPPARVAWIETTVAESLCYTQLGRHPRGWRG